MNVIWKCALPSLFPGETVRAGLPVDARFVHFGIQGGVSTVWFITEEPRLRDEPREQGVFLFSIVGTGSSWDPWWEHVATYFDGPFVWHVLVERPDARRKWKETQP